MGIAAQLVDVKIENIQMNKILTLKYFKSIRSVIASNKTSTKGTHVITYIVKLDCKRLAHSRKRLLV